MSGGDFRFQQFAIRQDRCAMKVGTDGVLLGAWALLPPTPPPTPRILDVGTGTGLVALMLAQRHGEARVVAIEMEADAAGQAQENAAASPFARRVSVETCQLQDFNADGHEPPFDCIACNPPFFTSSLKCPDAKRTMARHADTLPLRDLMHHAARLLADGGCLSVVLPEEARQEAETEGLLAGLRLARLWHVRTAPTKPPRRCLMELSKAPRGPVDERTITLGGPEHAEMTRPFLLHKNL